MAKLKILTYPHPNLRKVSKPVEKVDDEIRNFAKDLLETMYSAVGVGLAAPQVDRQIRMTVIDTRPLDEEGNETTEGMTDLEKQISYPLTLINPEIIKREGETTYGEGCLSVPGFYETIKRAEYIECKALNESGEEISLKTDGLLAICIQHEIDHLDGKLFIDRLSLVKGNRIKSKIKKFGYPEVEHTKKVL